MKLIKAVLIGAAFTVGIISIFTIVSLIIAFGVPIMIFLFVSFIAYKVMTEPSEPLDGDPKKPP